MNNKRKMLLDEPEKYKNKRFYLEEGCINDRETDLRKKDFLDVINELHEENKELKTVLKTVINQLYRAESNLIYEYSINISEDEKKLREYFNENTVNMGGKDDRGFVKDNYRIITCSYLGRSEYMTVLEHPY